MEKSGYTKCRTEEEALPGYEDSNVSEDSLLEEGPRLPQDSRSRRRRLMRLGTIHLGYILFYSIVSGIIIRHIRLANMNGPSLIYSK